MELNQLPEGFEGEQKRQTEFDSREAKLTHDAKGLICKAKLQSERLGTPVDPINFAQRVDDDISALRVAIAKEQKAVNPAIKSTPIKSAEADQRLITFKADFDKDSALQTKCTWEEIRNRLLANGGRYLALAQAMEQGGELFGVDKDGNPLISDRGDEPIMKGMNYKNTRDRVLYKHDDKDSIVRSEDGQPVSTGYEMFPYSREYNKSDEILQYETHTGKPFVKSPDGKEWRSSWLESDENPSWPRFVCFNPYYGNATVSDDFPRVGFPGRGVRRLLRVKKA